MREEFHALEMELLEFTAVLDGMMQNIYILLTLRAWSYNRCGLLREHSLRLRLTMCVCRDGGVKEKHPSCAAKVRGAPNRFFTCIDLTPRLCFSSSLVSPFYP